MTNKTILTVALASFFLVACGNDKPNDNAQPNTTQSQNQPKPANSATPVESKPQQTTEQQAATTTQNDSKETVAPSADFEAVVKAAAALPSDTGHKRYEASCKVCHETGMLDAPKISDKANWQNRLSKGKETLFNHSAKGFNKMPAQATGDVSEAEVYAAIEYILSQVS